MGHMAEAAAKRTKVSKAMVLWVSWGSLSAIGTLVVWEIDA